MSAAELLGLIALVIGLAVAAEILGDRMGKPNFLFYILAGLAVGPMGLGVIHHDVFGENLGVVVGLGVAIIIFHSGSGITRDELRKAPRTVIFLVTGGVIVTFLGSATVTYLMMNVTIELALLIGALLVATGTTVIEPLLAAVPVRDQLVSTLEIEATVTEVSAGILTITVFNAVALGEPDTIEFAFLFLWVLGVGIVVGLVGGTIAWFMFQFPDHAPNRAPHHASLLYLATAIVTFAAAENIAEEAGVAAVAVAGVILGNADLPYQDDIAEFEEHFTAFIISFIFVVLASFAEPEWLAIVGVEGLLVAAGVILLVRPLAVLLFTAGSVFSIHEKLFLSVASPRGIIPAGLATLVALDIQDSNPTVAAYITGTVLLVIILSGVLEGLFAGPIARRFDLTLETTTIVGGGRLGLALATRYETQGERVVIVESDWDALTTARSEGFTAYHGDGSDAAVLRDANVQRSSRVVAATDDDEVNYDIARLARREFDIESVLVRLNQIENEELFEDLDVELLTGSQLGLWALEHRIDQSIPDWVAALTRTGGVGSVTVTDDVELTVGEIDRQLSDRSFIVALTRDGRTRIPDAADPIESGDRLTLLGQSDAVERATERLSS